MIDLREYDRLIIETMYKWGIRSLRISLGIVFLWFGLLKIMNETPVEELIRNTYGFLPQEEFIAFLGAWEIVIGLGLIFKVYLRAVLVLLWMQMAGIFTSVILAPSIFFLGNPLYLTLEGEFVVKNLVLIAASIVIGGYRIRLDRDT